MTDICLVLMPYASVERPSIALGLLKSALTREGIKTKAIYANIWFARYVGLNDYYYHIKVKFPSFFASLRLVGEWTFSQTAFPDFKPDDEEFFQLINPNTDGTQNLSFVEREMGRYTLEHLRKMATPFINETAQKILKSNPKIVACSSTFDQHCASLALLKRIRELNPEIVTFMGGANCEGIMGKTTKQEFPWVDFVISGEGDTVVPQLCSQILQYGRDIPVNQLPYGVISKENCDNNSLNFSETRAFINDLDQIPIPDYEDYFETLESYGLRSYINPMVLVETSRGCWWGQKQHCTFCGLNGGGMTYRSKSPERVVQEFDYLHQQYGIKNFNVVDNILDLKYIDTVMPIFASLKKSYFIFWETKANLKHRQLEQLAKAGVRMIQPGIESMHNEALKLMKKGTTAEINVQLLKWCQEFGIVVGWGFLYNVPGENSEWYLETAKWIPLIFHLQPPYTPREIRFDRYSVYHQNPKQFSLNLRPNRLYSYIYPLSIDRLENLVYYFEREEDQIERDHSYQPSLKMGHQQLIEVIEQWSKLYTNGNIPPILSMVDDGHQILITDTRPCAVKTEHTLKNLAYWIYKSCNENQSSFRLLESINQNFNKSLNWEDIQPTLNYLIEQKLLLQFDDKFLSLAVRKSTFQLPKISNAINHQKWSQRQIKTPNQITKRRKLQKIDLGSKPFI